MTNEERLERKRQFTDDLEWVMSAKSGRRLVWRWLEITGFWESSFVRDPQAANFTNGVRHVGATMYQHLREHCFPQFQLMEKENHHVRPEVLDDDSTG